MKEFIAEFKAFAMRGNVVDLAVAVVVGAAFGKIVTSLVENIITPSIGVLSGGVDFTGLAFTLGSSTIKYGAFLQSVFDFLVVSFVIFMVVRAMAKLKKKTEEAPAAAKEPSQEIKLLTEIRDSLRR